MSKDTITLIVSIATVLISIATFLVAYSQMKIASAKTKLDLYNKRFAVYVSALDYYLATCNESHDEIKQKGHQFSKFYRESQFLFDPTDGVMETLGKILQNGADIYAYEEYKFRKENNLTEDRLDLSRMHENRTNAAFDFAKNLKNLERQINKYILFKTITGWKIVG